jgi:hypothetical protein
MDKHLQRILQLVALGRITPAEAEHLWAAWRDERASGWMVVVAIGMASLATAHSLLAGPHAAGALEAIHQFLGGAL